MFYFLKIYIYKNTKNCYQYHSILTILFYFFFFESDGLKINFLKKFKKYPGDIIILHKCTTNQNHMISVSQDIGCDEWIFFFVILDQFFHFFPKNSLKNQVWKNEKNACTILHLHNKNHDLIALQFLRYRARQTKIFIILGHFMLFYPLPQKLKKSKFWENKKTPGDIIMLHLCTKNQDDTIYSSWGMERDRLKLAMLDHFLPFNPLKNPQNQNFEKVKKFAQDIITLHTKNCDHTMHGSWNTEWDR